MTQSIDVVRFGTFRSVKMSLNVEQFLYFLVLLLMSCGPLFVLVNTITQISSFTNFTMMQGNAHLISLLAKE